MKPQQKLPPHSLRTASASLAAAMLLTSLPAFAQSPAQSAPVAAKPAPKKARG